MDSLQYRIYTIKNKYLRLAAKLAAAVALLGFLAAITMWAWLMLRPLGYSYSQVFFGWLVISLAADRVRIAWQERQRQRFYKAHAR